MYSITALQNKAPKAVCSSYRVVNLPIHKCTVKYSPNNTVVFTDGWSHQQQWVSILELEQLEDWCKDNNLSVNVDKMVELTTDFKTIHIMHSTPHIKGLNRESQERPTQFQFNSILFKQHFQQGAVTKHFTESRDWGHTGKKKGK